MPESQSLIEIGRLLGELTQRLSAVESWQQKWETRAGRLFILAGLAIWTVLSNLSPKELGELAGSTLRSLLSGG